MIPSPRVTPGAAIICCTAFQLTPPSLELNHLMHGSSTIRSHATKDTAHVL